MLSDARVDIAVLVSGGGTNLQALLDAQASGALRSGRVALVVSDREGAYALERARNAGVEARCLSRRGQSQAEWEKRLAALLDSRGVGLVVLAGFLTLLGAAFIGAFRGRLVNVHPSLVPAFCGKGYYGLRVHEAALARGVRVTGATVHLVDEVPDGGPILLQKAVRVRRGDTPQSLQKRVMERAEWVLLPRACETLCKNLLKEGDGHARNAL